MRLGKCTKNKNTDSIVVRAVLDLGDGKVLGAVPLEAVVVHAQQAKIIAAGGCKEQKKKCFRPNHFVTLNLSIFLTEWL